MIITYERPDNFGHEHIDPEAPHADLSPIGAFCGSTTTDVSGVDWFCTRAPHPGEDEHRAAFERDGDGPDGTVGLAWTYQYTTEDRSDGIVHATPTHSLTVILTFPARAANGINTERVTASMINAALDHFWEGDLDDFRSESRSTVTPDVRSDTAVG